ncbi:Metal dependent amidohydrolase [Minicystis rosea]|nr:Metal dependent amidohydrolase [Minicystis rosea]
MHSGTTVDAFCYGDTAATQAAFIGDSSYSCEGQPASNPNGGDTSMERKPGGAGGNCVDTNDNASDFATAMPSTPQNAASAPTP